MVKKSLLVRLEAKPGKEAEVEAFLRSALSLAEDEKGTITCYAIRINQNTYGIFNTFNDDAGRETHLNGSIAKALMAKASHLFSQPPAIEMVNVLAVKEKEVTSA